MIHFRLPVAALLLAVMAVAPTAAGREECTSAVIGVKAAAGGAPILWKNRDTDKLSNKVVFVRDVPHSYLALVNADYPSGRQCYAGLNDTGFAIMNTVAYNLPEEPGELQDLEGIIMADALRTCRTVDDFERYIQAGLGPDLGSLANFGVIDADGRAVLFELHNHGYQKYDADHAEVAPRGYIVNTNFARSGSPGKGAGYLRHERASALFRELPDGGITPRALLARLARDTGHALLRQPTLDDARRTPGGDALWIWTKDCVNKAATSCAVIIEGRRPGEPGSRATFWIVPGEPVTTVALPLWVEAGEVPAPFHQGSEAPLWRESLRLKQTARPFTEREKEEYLNLARLDNAGGTGFLPRLQHVEAEILDAAEARRGQACRPAELARFQDEMARMALAALAELR
jgi:hypothetical protein